MALTIWELALKLHQTCKSLSACLALWLSLHFEVELFLIHSPVVSVNTTYHENYTTSQTSYPNLLCVWCEASENHQKDSSLLQKWGQIQTLTALPVKCRNGTSGTPFLPTLVFYTCFFLFDRGLNYSRNNSSCGESKPGFLTKHFLTGAGWLLPVETHTFLQPVQCQRGKSTCPVNKVSWDVPQSCKADTPHKGDRPLGSVKHQIAAEIGSMPTHWKRAAKS